MDQHPVIGEKKAVRSVDRLLGATLRAWLTGLREKGLGAIPTKRGRGCPCLSASVPVPVKWR